MANSKDKFEKLSREEKISLMFDLINSFRIVRNPLETAFFLQDLLTANEIRNLSIRLRIAKLLLNGKNFREIKDEVHSSFTTISKVSVWLESGGEGFKNVIKRLPLKWDIPKTLPKGPVEFHLPQTLLTLAQYGIAKHQTKNIEKFVKSIKSKKSLDRELKKQFDEFYRELALEKKSLRTRKSFSEKIRKIS
jgi:TrpR-related protein YerC/YecD